MHEDIAPPGVRRSGADPLTSLTLAAAVAITAAFVVVDIAVSGIVVITVAVFSPLVASVRLRPLAVALLGAGAVAAGIGATFWNEDIDAQHAVRVGTIAAGSIVAVAISALRLRLERERWLERMLAELATGAARAPHALARDIAVGLVPELADGARVRLFGDGRTRWLGEAGVSLPDDPTPPVPPAPVRGEPDGWTVVTPLQLGARRLGTIELHRARRRFDASEREFAQRVASRAALAVENALLLHDMRALSARLGNEHKRLREVIEQLPAGVSIYDAEGNVVLSNRRALEIGEIAGAAREDRRPLWRALRHGQPAQDVELPVDRAGTERMLRVSTAPLRDEHERVNGAVSVFDDITEEHRDRRALRWLASASQLLDRPHAIETRIEELLRLLLEDLADGALLYVRRPGGELAARLAVARGPELEQALRAVHAREARDVPAGHPAALAIRAEAPAMLRAGSESLEAAARTWLERATACSALLVPIIRASEGVGCLVFVQAQDRAFDEHDVEVLRILSARVGLALENARLYAEQHQVATVLQRDLLPPALPDWPGIELASLHRPARSAADVGGDFIDAFEASGRRMLVVGDVSGKGVEAAATTALVRHAVRSAIRSGALGRDGLALVNHALVQDAPGEQFCTLAWAELQREADGVAVRLAVAGHPPPLVVRVGGTVEVSDAGGTLLGFYEEVSAHTVETTLAPGDALVLFTDGVTEARRDDGSLFELEGLCRALEARAAPGGADELIAAIEDALARECATARDDVAIVSALVLE